MKSIDIMDIMEIMEDIIGMDMVMDINRGIVRMDLKLQKREMTVRKKKSLEKVKHRIPHRILLRIMDIVSITIIDILHIMELIITGVGMGMVLVTITEVDLKLPRREMMIKEKEFLRSQQIPLQYLDTTIIDTIILELTT